MISNSLSLSPQIVILLKSPSGISLLFISSAILSSCSFVLSPKIATVIRGKECITSFTIGSSISLGKFDFVLETISLTSSKISVTL